MKRLFALFLVVVMCAALAVPAMAEAGGTITIKNAEVGKTYTVVKAFDAETSGSSIAYSLDATQSPNLYNLIANAVPSPSGIVCPFMVIETTEDGIYAVEHQPDPEKKEFGRGWLKEMYVDGTAATVDGVSYPGWKGEGSPASKTCAFGEKAVVFDLATTGAGYYMMIPEGTTAQEGIASVVTAAPNAVIYDKNPGGPSNPDKTVNDAYVEMGDIITYEASFLATNYYTITVPTRNTKMISEYLLKDQATGLQYNKLVSIKGYMKKTVDETTGEVKWEQPWDGETGDIAYEPYQKEGTGYTIRIPWVVTAEGKNPEPKYPSPMYVVAVYEMMVDSTILNYKNEGDNHFAPSFVAEGETIDIPEPPDVKVHTTGLSLFKTDGNKTLTGAKFILAKVMKDAQQQDVLKYYTIGKKKSASQLYEYDVILWKDKEDAFIREAGNKLTEQTFGGLGEGTYKLFEVEAPYGYAPPTEPWTIEITHGETGKFTATITDPGSTVAKTLDLASANEWYFAASILNTPTSPLPETGAAGTTMLLLVGGAMFAVTMLFLVTKKRLYNEG